MTENNDYSYLLDIINLVDNNNKSDEQKIAINFEGDFLDNQQIGSYNNNLIYLISKDSNFDLALSPKCIIDKNTDNSIKQLISNNIDKTDINIQHFNKSSFFMPKQGHWISLNNWQYGSLPKTWLESINDYVDEVWVSSSYNKQCYIDSGVNSEKIQVINYGVDPLVFNPNIDAEDLKIDKKIKFIYKGDLSWQSGFDKLLKAYTEEFCADEDICLIIITDESTHKDNINKIQEVTSLNDSPQIILIQKDLRDHDLARIYAYSNFMVSVQRVQNFCADTVNFMACGKVVISNDYGSVLDYCSESNSIPVKTERVYQSEHNIEGIETIDYPYWGEVDNNSLRVALRKAYDLDKLEYSILGKQASKTILDNFTYIKTGEISKGLMKNLLNKSIKRDVQEKFNNILLTGLNYLTKGDYDNSYIALKESWDIYPENESVNFYLANLMMAKSDYVQALEYNLNCLAVNPNQEDYNNLLGIILYKLGDYKLAESFLKKTLQLMPEHGGAKESLKAIETIRNSQFDNTDLINDKRLFLESLITENNSLDSYSLSVCILTKNEESTIEKAIRSVKDIADEIIILDTGSTDKTIDILKNHQVQLFTDIWHNDFSQARNEVMSHANCDWILMLDADECVEMELKDSIKPLLKNLSKNKVYQTKIVNFIDKNNIDEKIEHYVVRLLPNYKGIKYIRAIHEYPVNKDDSIIESEILNGLEIKHTGYLSNNVKEKDKIQRNRSILEKALSNDPQSIIDYFYLAENYKEENNYQKTIEYSEKVIELEEKFSQFESIIKMAKMNIIESMIVLKKYDQAFDKSEYFQKNLESRPDYWFLKGSIEYNRNNYNQAIKYEQKALSLRSQIIYPSIDIGAISWKPLSLIAESYVKLEDYKNASLYYRRALKEYPQNINFYYSLIEIYSNLNDLNSLENILSSFIKLISPNQISDILEKIYIQYFTNNNEDRLYKLLESIRQEKLTSHDSETDTLAHTIIKIYSDIINKYPQMVAVKYSLACTYENTKNYDKAEAIFEELSSEESDSLHNLASIAFSKNDLIKAELLYKKVLEQDEFHVQSYISLAKLEIKRNDLIKANNYIEQLKNLDPDNKEIAQLEFEVAKSSGNKKLASDMYASMLFRSSLN